MIRNEFKVHKLSEDGLENARKIARIFSTVLSELDDICAEGRSFSIAKTHLETACFFAKRAMCEKYGELINE